MATLADIMLTLPDREGWYDRLLIYGTPDDCRVYAGSFRDTNNGIVITEARLATRCREQQGSLHPLDVIGRHEAQRRIQW